MMRKGLRDFWRNRFVSLLPPKSDWYLVWALGAVYLLFPLSKTAYALPLLAVIVYAGINGRPTMMWSLLRETPLLFLPLALYVWILLQSFTSPADLDVVWEHLRKYGRLILFVFLFLALAGYERRQRVALNAFAGAMALTVCLTWLRLVWPHPWLGAQGHAIFGDYITQNIMVAFFSVLAFCRARESTTRQATLLWGLLAILAAISITHQSIGRTGQVMLLVAWLSYVMWSLRGVKLAFGLACLAFGTLVVYASSEPLRDRFQLAFAEARNAEADPLSSIGHRIDNYRTTPRMIAEKPLLGHGTAAFHKEICRFLDKPETCPVYERHPHNQFLFFAADHGLIGAGLYLAFVIGLIVAAVRSKAAQTARILLLTLGALLLVNSLINSPLYSSRESQFFMFMAALLLAMNARRASHLSTVEGAG